MPYLPSDEKAEVAEMVATVQAVSELLSCENQQDVIDKLGRVSLASI